MNVRRICFLFSWFPSAGTDKEIFRPHKILLVGKIASQQPLHQYLRSKCCNLYYYVPPNTSATIAVAVIILPVANYQTILHCFVINSLFYFSIYQMILFNIILYKFPVSLSSPAPIVPLQELQKLKTIWILGSYRGQYCIK